MTASPRMVPPAPPERTSELAPESDAHSEDVLRMIEATARTYTAAGPKRLASRLGWCLSKLHKQTRLPDERQADEPIERADRRGPGEVIVLAVREARRMHASEERAAAILIETCRQLGYDALRRVEFVEGFMQGAADSIETSGVLSAEIAQAIRDGRVEPEERRRIAQKARHGIEALRTLIVACENETMAEVQQIARGRRG